MRVFPDRKSYFMKLMLSYTALVLSVTLLICATSYTLASAYSQKMMSDLDNDVLKQYAELFGDAIVSQVNATYRTLIADNLLTQAYAHSLVQGGSLSLWTAYNAYASLQKLINTAPHIAAIHVLYVNSRVLISSRLGLKYVDMYEDRLSDILPWREPFLSQAEPSQWMNLPDGEIYFVAAYPNMQLSAATMMVAFELDMAAVRKELGRLTSAGTHGILLMDSAGRCIAQSGTSDYAPDLPQTVGETKGGVVRADGQNFYVTRATIPGNDWYLYKVTPMNELFSGFRSIQRAIVLIGALCAVAGLAVAYVTTRRMYDPLRRVTELLRKKGSFAPADFPSGGNEYALLGHAITQVDQRLSDLRAQMEHNRPLLEHNFLLGLVDAQITQAADIEQWRGLIGLPAEEGAPCYCLLLACQEDVHAVLDLAVAQMLEFELAGKMMQLAKPPARCVATRLRPNCLCALYMGEGHPQRIAQELREDAMRRYGMPVYVGVGAAVRHMVHLRDSYTQAAEALAYARMMPNACTWFFADLPRGDAQPPQTLESALARLRQCIHLRDEGEALPVLDELLAALPAVGLPLCALEGFARRLCACVSGVQGAEDAPLPDMPTLSRQLRAQLGARMEALARSGGKTDELIRRVKAYIGAHLGEDLSLSQLSAHAGVSRSYLSRVFKERERQNLLDYITELRLQKAGALLADTRMSIDSIALSVGFMTHHYFAKRFKTRFSLTPSDYRAQRASERGYPA